MWLFANTTAVMSVLVTADADRMVLETGQNSAVQH